MRAAAGYDGTHLDSFAQSCFVNKGTDQFEGFPDTGRDDPVHRALLHDARYVGTDRADFECILGVDSSRVRRAGCYFYLFRLGKRCAQPDGDVGGDMAATDGQYFNCQHRVVAVDGDISGAAAKIDQQAAQGFFVRAQAGICGRNG